jgi:hypothetical protein
VSIRTQSDEQAVTVRLLDDRGVVAPMRFTIGPGRNQQCAVVPLPQARGPLTLEFSLANGVVQRLALRPEEMGLPLVAVTIDGSPDEWPHEACLPEGTLITNRPVDGLRAWLGWSQEGLAVAADMPVAGLSPGNPSSFWDATCFELFLEPDVARRTWGAESRQFVLVPVRDGETWRLWAGNWDRRNGGSSPEETIRSALSIAGSRVSIEALIPWDRIGFTLTAGKPARLALALQGVGRDQAWQASWPRPKNQGLLDGPDRCGIVRARE